MPSKLPVGPPGAGKRQVWGNEANWPKGPGFYEESWPRPRSTAFRLHARGFAWQVAAGERAVYVDAVAREATKRVLRLRLFEPPNREPLVGYRHAEVGPSYGECQAHVEHVRRELAWECEKWSVQHNTFRWRQCKYSPNFLCWLQSVPAAELLRWAITYLPAERRTLQLVRQGLAQLAPMPEEIRKAYFLSVADERQLLTLAGAEVDLGATTEHHVALVCQRLLALHTAENARHGAGHVAHMAARLERHLALPRQHVWAAEELLEVVNRAVILSQGRATRAEVDATMVRVRAALQRGQAILERRADLETELEALRPANLELQETCAMCGDGKARAVEMAQLPPFHPLCRCFRLAWRSDQEPELERKVTLWSLECVLWQDRLPRFPLEEFIVACEASRPTVRNGPQESPARRAHAMAEPSREEGSFGRPSQPVAGRGTCC